MNKIRLTKLNIQLQFDKLISTPCTSFAESNVYIIIFSREKSYARKTREFCNSAEKQNGGREGVRCCSCFSTTKYTCLICGHLFSKRSSVFGEGEGTPSCPEISNSTTCIFSSFCRNELREEYIARTQEGVILLV